MKRLVTLELPIEEATNDDLRVLYDQWQMPMYDIDTKSRLADLDTLKTEQASHLNAQYDHT